MSKVKFEIKNKWTGSVLFEYEKENNSIKETVEEAVKQGADLRRADLRGAGLKGANLKGVDLRGVDLRGADLEGVDLEGADLRGASLKGAYIYLTDVDDHGAEFNTAINNFEKNSNITIKETYTNRNVIPTRWNCFWKYGLIICDWEVNKEKVKKMTVSEICKELGYDVEIIKESEVN